MQIRRACAEHPQAMANLLARLGYAEKPVEASLMIVGIQYAVLRRPFLEIGGTSLERERSHTDVVCSCVSRRSLGVGRYRDGSCGTPRNLTGTSRYRSFTVPWF